MKRAFIRMLPIGVLVLLLVAGGALVPGSASSKSPIGNNVLRRAVDLQLGRVQAANKADIATRVSGSVVQAALERLGTTAPGRVQRAPQGPAGVHKIGSPRSLGCPNVFHGLGRKNTRVNQDCTLRRQAEEWVGVNPRDFDNVVAGQNDSVIGFNHCGYDWSYNGGKDWGSVGTAPPPFSQQVFASTNDTADACSDPAATFDHLGNVYITGVFFEVADFESAIWVAKSNWPNGGAFYHAPNSALSFQEYRTAPLGVVADDNNPEIFHDKELMIADSRAGSSKQGNVYVTWTRFEDRPGTVDDRSPIVFSQSTDGGANWSPAVVISGNNPAICTDFSVEPGDCDQDQGSHPVVGPDGTIYVAFGNGNTPNPGENQVLLVKCPPSEDCNDSSDWSQPVKVGDLIGTHPIGNPGNPGGCPVGRQCLPPNGYRIPEFTSITTSVDHNSNVYVTWSDFRNGDDPGSTCGPLLLWTAATPPCDNDVFYSFSTDGGATFSATRNVTPAARLGANAQFMPWSDVAGDGSKLYAGFYDRRYGDCEFTGCNDVTLAVISSPRSSSPSISYTRVTTASMPNLVPANNPVQAGFNGDYTWLEVSRHNFNQTDVHMVWSDTRPLPGRLAHQQFPEEDIYYAQLDRNGH